MAEAVDLAYHIGGIGDPEDVDLGPRRGGGADGNVAHADDALPDALHEIYGPHVLDPDLILIFRDQTFAYDDAARGELVAGALDLDQNEDEDEKSDQNREQDHAQYDPPQIIHGAGMIDRDPLFFLSLIPRYPAGRIPGERCPAFRADRRAPGDGFSAVGAGEQPDINGLEHFFAVRTFDAPAVEKTIDFVLSAAVRAFYIHGKTPSAVSIPRL